MAKKYPQIQQVSIKGVLCRGGKVLVLKTVSGRWEMPGGRINFSESAEEAFQREMKEELGFESVRLGKLLNMWSFTSVRNDVDYHFMVFDFEFFSDESKIKLSDEHTEFKWIEKSEFESLDMRDGHKDTLRKYFSNIGN